MLEEVVYDTARNQLHISPFLSGQGQRDYPDLLRQAVESGNEETLAENLRAHRRIARTMHRRKPQGGYTIVTVPVTAPETLAESEFNRYYIRALCRRAVEDGIKELIVYRAKPVGNPRPESEALIETVVDPAALLEDLRAHIGDEDPALGIPGGPNSGLSVRLP
jgi:DNA repair photolyase